MARPGGAQVDFSWWLPGFWQIPLLQDHCESRTAPQQGQCLPSSPFLPLLKACSCKVQVPVVTINKLSWKGLASLTGGAQNFGGSSQKLGRHDAQAAEWEQHKRPVGLPHDVTGESYRATIHDTIENILSDLCDLTARSMRAQSRLAHTWQAWYCRELIVREQRQMMDQLTCEKRRQSCLIVELRTIVWGLLQTEAACEAGCHCCCCGCCCIWEVCCWLDGWKEEA